MSADSKTTATKLNSLQWHELYRVRKGNGRYRPSGRAIATIKALANRRLITFDAGYGWSILPEVEEALDAKVKENPYAF